MFDEIFGAPAAPVKVKTVAVSEERLKKYAGLWKNDVTRSTITIALDKAELKLNGAALSPIADGAFLLGDRRLRFKDGSPTTAEIANADGSVTRLSMVLEWKPATVDLKDFVGDWYSEEAQAKVSFVVEGDNAFIVNKPVLRLPLKPLYKDHFSTQGYVVWVKRDAKGNIDTLHVGGSRMRDMLFERAKK